MIRLEVNFDLPEDAAPFAEWALRRAVGIAQEEAAYKYKTAKTDIADFCKKEGAAVPSSTYGIPAGYNFHRMHIDYGVLPYSEFEHIGGMDVPVRMRGSKAAIEQKYNRGVGWSGFMGEWRVEVIKRYLRRIKFTSFSRYHIRKTVISAINRSGDYFHYRTGEAIERRFIPESWSVKVCYIGGVQHLVSDGDTWRLLKNQAKLLEKVDRLQ